MIDYKVIKAIQENPAHTQRSLAKKLNISLGKVNYVLTGLTEKGLIRARRLKNHPAKIRWQYILTPKGMKEKARIAKNYLVLRMKEFDDIQKEIDELKSEVELDTEKKKD